MPTPIDPRKKPKEVKVHVKTGAGVDIVWMDGHSSHFDFPFLRDHCPCATCNDERDKKESMGGGVSLTPSPAPADIQAESAGASSHAGGKLRHPDQFQRWPFHGDFQLRLPAHAVPVPRMRQGVSRGVNPVRCLIWNVELARLIHQTRRILQVKNA